jgi:hypothetical protein
VGCLALTGYAFRQVFVEEWYLRELDSKDPGRRQRAIVALAEMRSSRVGLRLLQRGDAVLFGEGGVSAILRSTIEDLGARALPAIGRARKEYDVRWLFDLDQLAGNILSRISPEDREAIPGLLEVLSWKDSALQAPTAWLLKRIGPAAASAVPALIALLADERYPVRHHAALALGKIRPGTVEVIPVLIEVLKTIPPPLEAVKALGDLGPAARDAVPAIIDVLNAESMQTRACAAWALGKIGPGAREAAPVLEEALAIDDPELRRYARWALRRIGPASAPAMAGGGR